ncbi:MAG TPA: hypothetical protein VMW87_14255 [Spirochaetia bacterium]|nr:hypothetical protein [Spirochaetia bacterium]
MRRTQAAAIFVAVLAVACSQSSKYVVLVDTFYAAAHEPGAIEQSLKQAEQHTGASIKGIVVPPNSDSKLFATLPLAGTTLILTPLLAPDVGLLSRIYPTARFAVMESGDNAATVEDKPTTAILFDRASALLAAGVTLGKFAAGAVERPETGAVTTTGGVWILFLADSASLRSDLATFREGLSAGLGAEAATKAHFAVYDSPPGRDELRATIQEARAAGAAGYALFVGRQNAYCFELLAGTAAKVVTSDLMGNDAYAREVLCSVEEPLSSAIQAVTEAGSALPGIIHVQALLEDSGADVIPRSSSPGKVPTR